MISSGNSIDKAVDILINAMPAGSVITDSGILDKYSRDETSGVSAMPKAVVRASSAEEVSTVMKTASEYMVPVYPRGGGTGVTGGAIPVEDGIVLSLEKMNRIIEIDTANLCAVVEPGAITGDISRAALEAGLFYPPDPASLDSCSIGGNVAEIAGGPRAVKYGTTKDYVLGLEFVLPDGSIISTGGRFVKNATGYNLIGILLGSEGTLAVITKIILRLIPAPAFSADFMIPFDTMDRAVEAVAAITAAGIVPAAIEFMERDAIQLASGFLKSGFPFNDAGAHLILQIDGDSDDGIASLMEKAAIAAGVNTDTIAAAFTDADREKIWKTRRAVREAITQVSPVFLAEDCVVPRAEIARYIRMIKNYLDSLELRSVIFGHAGDGNLHIDVLKENMDDISWQNIVPKLKQEIYRMAVSLGGTISGEHGIGFTRKEYLSIALSDAEIKLCASIKKAFDPDNILNPGKIFTADRF
jgi:glycolate oxidase